MRLSLIKKKKFYIREGLALLFIVLISLTASGQDTVDKIVATIYDDSQTELVTYSDLLWQLALVPGVPINPPDDEDLQRALQLVVNQRMISLEASRLPRAEPTEDEVNAEILRIVDQFPNPTVFTLRLNSVGFKSADDENFVNLIANRVAIEKYIDFRFRSFVVITPEDELRYYRDEFTPEFRKENPGLLLPPFDDVRNSINQILTERTVESEIEAFLDDARSRTQIDIVSPV